MERDIDIRCPKCGSKNVIKLNSDDKIENQIASKAKYLVKHISKKTKRC